MDRHSIPITLNPTNSVQKYQLKQGYMKRSIAYIFLFKEICNLQNLVIEKHY